MTPDALDDGLLVKVRKLLAMAEGSANPNEADAFSRKAAELIAAHRIDPDRLRAEADDDLSVLEIELGRGAYVRGRLGLLQVIAEAHGCLVVFEVRRPGHRGVRRRVPQRPRRDRVALPLAPHAGVEPHGR